MSFCGSPVYGGKGNSRQSSAHRNKQGGNSEIQIERDPFANLFKNCSNKLLPLSPKFKLPKLSAALPPRPSLGAIPSKPQEKCLNFPLETEKTEEKCFFQIKPKGRRIKIKGSLSNTNNQGDKIIRKKRNSVILLDSENDVTFGAVGNLVIKNIEY